MKQNSKQALAPKLRFPEFQSRVAWSNSDGGELFESIQKRADATAGLPLLAITQEHGAIPRDQIDYHVSVTEKSIESYKEVEVGDFIISLRSFQGGIEYSLYHGICSPAYIVLRRKGEGYDAFFKQLFKSQRFIQQLTRNIEGLRDGKMISYKQFSEQAIPTPQPDEQRKIADCLSSLDEVITAQARKVEALKAHKHALMQQLFPREGKNSPRIRLPNYRNGPRWSVARVGELFETMTGGTPERGTNHYWGGTIPWITTSLIDFNVIYNAEESISEAGLRSSSAKLFPKGTVLIAMYGQGKTRGKVALLGVEAATNQACAALLPGDTIDPAFTFMSLCGRYDEMRRLSNSGGQENLSQGIVRDLLFWYPDDVAEQREIVACLSTLDSMIAAHAQKLDALRTHKAGLMQKLFPPPAESEP